MKTLLIYPGLIEGFDSYKRGQDWYNHGLGIISSILNENHIQSSYLDCRQLKGWDDLKEKINSIDFSIALISIATVDFEYSKKLAAIIKKKDPNIKIIVGGPHPTLMTEETAKVKNFDVIFTHEAEITLPPLLKSINSTTPKIIKGSMPNDLDSLPYVDRSFSPSGETSWFKGLEKPFFSITASRGCIFKCSFCQPAERFVFGNVVRKRSVDNVLNELEMLDDKYKMKSFIIHDDCFTQFYSWVQEFCEKKIKRKLLHNFACQSRADIICKRPDIIKKLKEAGLQWFLIGFESGSDRVLKFINKGTTSAQNIEAAKICKKNGIKIFANYMFGIPTETNQEMKMTAIMMKKINPDWHSPSVFTPAPGSYLYNYCLENDLILIKNSSDYRRNALSGEKIKGIDYKFLRKMVLESYCGSFSGCFKSNILKFKYMIKDYKKLLS